MLHLQSLENWILKTNDFFPSGVHCELHIYGNWLLRGVIRSLSLWKWTGTTQNLGLHSISKDLLNNRSHVSAFCKFLVLLQHFVLKPPAGTIFRAKSMSFARYWKVDCFYSQIIEDKRYNLPYTDVCCFNY